MEGACRRQRRLRACLFLVGLVAVSVRAEEAASGNVLDLSLEELMHLKVDTASIVPATQREQPGMVTVITAADMAAAGAHTLQDVLLLVPGVSLGIDVFNVTGLTFRGTWAYEGKILFLVDDMPVNDLLFGIYAMPPDFPVAMLSRVEVLRGPGGAKYGGNAELAVIRIYTRNSTSGDGFASVNLAAGEHGRPLRQLTAGEQLAVGGGSLAMVGTTVAANWGTGRWTDANGSTINTASLEQRSAQFAVDARWGGSHLQYYGEAFTQDAVQRYGIAVPDQVISFRDDNLRFEHEFHLDAATSLIPRLSYRSEDAWYGTAESLPSLYELPASQYRLELEGRHDLANGSRLRLGLDDCWTAAHVDQLFVPDAFPGKSPANYLQGGNAVSYRSFSAYGEAALHLGDYQLSLGLRSTRFSGSGVASNSATVPRLVLTRAETDWHAKLLWDSAYREPQIETLNQAAGPLNPERVTVQEVEYGHALGRHQYLTGSLFSYQLHDAIVFSVSPEGIPGYVNSPRYTGNGVELQWRAHYPGWRWDANYEHSRTSDKAIAPYAVTASSGQSLGAPADIANFWLARQFSAEWSAGPRLRYQGAFTANVFVPGAVTLVQARLPATTTLDLDARYQRHRWTVDLGLSNVFDTRLLLPQPYAGNSPPFPYHARTLWLGGRYEW